MTSPSKPCCGVSQRVTHTGGSTRQPDHCMIDVESALPVLPGQESAYHTGTEANDDQSIPLSFTPGYTSSAYGLISKVTNDVFRSKRKNRKPSAYAPYFDRHGLLSSWSPAYLALFMFSAFLLMIVVRYGAPKIVEHMLDYVIDPSPYELKLSIDHNHKIPQLSQTPTGSINQSSDIQEGTGDNLLTRRRILDMLQAATRPVSETDPLHQRFRTWKRKMETRLKNQEDISINSLQLQRHRSKLHDEDDVYLNFTHFIKIYQDMNENLRIYVYKDGYKPLVHGAKTTGVYATEGLFLKRMEDTGNKYIVTDPSIAKMFLLPYSVRQMADYIQDPYTGSMRTVKTFIANYVERIAGKYPYWNRTRGADHFFLSCHDWAPVSTRNHVELHENAMKVVCNADITVDFDLHKDVSIPQMLIGGNQSYLDVGNLDPEERDILAFYAGQMHGTVRPQLIKHWKDKDPDMKVYEVLPPSIALNMSYVAHMKRSKFCLCPKGFEVNSPRIVESILNGCVPVIIADHFVLPFSDVLNWSKFSITVLEKDIPDLKETLTSVPDDVYLSMQRRLKSVRRHFVWLEESEDSEDDTQFDAFHMILYSIWRQSLHRQTTSR